MNTSHIYTTGTYITQSRPLIVILLLLCENSSINEKYMLNSEHYTLGTEYALRTHIMCSESIATKKLVLIVAPKWADHRSKEEIELRSRCVREHSQWKSLK